MKLTPFFKGNAKGAGYAMNCKEKRKEEMSEFSHPLQALALILKIKEKTSSQVCRLHSAYTYTYRGGVKVIRVASPGGASFTDTRAHAHTPTHTHTLSDKVNQRCA